MESVANLSIREAVKHFNVSRPTLTKALKSGKIAGVQDGQGQWNIDPADLVRVYQARKPEVVSLESDGPVNLSTANTPLSAEVEALKERLHIAEQRAAVAEAEKRAAEALAEERARHLDDLRRMLPSPTPSQVPPMAPVKPKRSWWPF